jgi:hypothetical protein
VRAWALEVVMDDGSYLVDEPTCPACGHKERDAWEIDFGGGMEGDTEVQCGACDVVYFCSRSVSIYYHCEPLAAPNTAKEPGR